eukprot:12386438-Heterocapsa_arctica.AAC.1
MKDGTLTARGKDLGAGATRGGSRDHRRRGHGRRSSRNSRIHQKEAKVRRSPGTDRATLSSRSTPGTPTAQGPPRPTWSKGQEAPRRKEGMEPGGLTTGYGGRKRQSSTTTSEPS